MVAQGASLREVASSKVRRLLSRGTSLGCADGDSALFYKTANGRSAPRWRRPAKIWDIDETGATVKFQG